MKPQISVKVTENKQINKERKELYDNATNDFRKVRVFLFIDWKNSKGLPDYQDTKAWKAIREAVLEEALKVNGLAGTAARWSWKAGCSCGCSPAFIIDFRAPYDIFVDFVVEIK